MSKASNLFSSVTVTQHCFHKGMIGVEVTVLDPVILLVLLSYYLFPLKAIENSLVTVLKCSIFKFHILTEPVNSAKAMMDQTENRLLNVICNCAARRWNGRTAKRGQYYISLTLPSMSVVFRSDNSKVFWACSLVVMEKRWYRVVWVNLQASRCIQITQKHRYEPPSQILYLASSVAITRSCLREYKSNTP